MPIDFLYFDMGNVLLHFSHEKAAREMARVAGCSVELVRRTVFEEDLEWEYESGRLDDQEFYRRFCDRTLTQPDFAALENAACDIFQVNEPLLPLLRDLRQEGWRMGVFSNTNAAHWRFVVARHPFITELFDVFALSFELGAMKPQAQIYPRAAAKAGVSSAGIFFTDDRPDNVAAARKAGWQAVVFESPELLRGAISELPT